MNGESHPWADPEENATLEERVALLEERINYLYRRVNKLYQLLGQEDVPSNIKNPEG